MKIGLILLLSFTSLLAQEFLEELDEFIEPTTTVGAYGEVHYNWEKMDNDDEATQSLDFHRFVLYLSHAWTKHWSFKSELELEHNYVNDGHGELQLEQAYINYHHNRKFGFQVGVILPSLGYINENHEPQLFLSVERPDYATKIIPTTWFGNGAAIYGKFTEFAYKVSVMEGLNGRGFSDDGIRGGRQKGFKPNAADLLYNARIDFTVIHGLIMGGSFTYNDAYVDPDSNIATTIFEVHANYIHNKFHTLFEYGQISFDAQDGGFDVKKAMGFYFDFGYDISDLFGYDGHIIPWVRYTDYNTSASVIGGGVREKENHYSKLMVGLSVKPIIPLVFKIDFGIKTREAGKEKAKLLNLGAGYMF